MSKTRFSKSLFTDMERYRSKEQIGDNNNILPFMCKMNTLCIAIAIGIIYLCIGKKLERYTIDNSDCFMKKVCWGQGERRNEQSR